MKRLIAVNSNSYHKYTIEEAIDGISSIGFHYIELTATRGWKEHVSPTVDFEYLRSVKERLNKADVAPFSMSGHCNLMDRERIGDFLESIKLAAFFGCTYIVTSVGEAHLKDNRIVSDEEAAENIRKTVPHLEENNLTLVLENHGEHATGKSVKKIVDLVNSPHVLINYDTANVVYYADIDPLDDIPTCVDKIGYLHVKDKIGGLKEWNFPALGEGELDFPGIIGLLDRAKNNSPFSVEIEFTPDGPKSLEEVNRAVKVSHDYLVSLGMEI